MLHRFPSNQPEKEIITCQDLSRILCLIGSDDPHFPEEVGYHDPGQEQRARYPDKRKKKITRLFGPWMIERPDGMEINKEAEAQPDKEANRFNHKLDST